MLASENQKQLIAAGLAALDCGKGAFEAWFQSAWPLREFHALALPAPVDTPYARHVLYAGKTGEAMLATWRAGACSAVHDHGGANGAVIILDGDFVETHFHLRHTDLKAGKSLRHGPGMVARVSAHSIHDMRALERGLTLHLYAPEPAPIRLFDAAAHCTVTVSSHAGAWLPANPEHVLTITPWVQP